MGLGLEEVVTGAVQPSKALQTKKSLVLEDFSPLNPIGPSLKARIYQKRKIVTYGVVVFRIAFFR